MTQSQVKLQILDVDGGSQSPPSLPSTIFPGQFSASACRWQLISNYDCFLTGDLVNSLQLSSCHRLK
jgi:hypothetical protein